MDENVDVKGKKVLIIEDDPLLHTLLTDGLSPLSEKGLEIYPTMNAEQGLERATSMKPDLILLDLVLPEMSGFEFLEKLREGSSEYANIPVVILSNLSDDSDREKAKKLGAIAYLVKADFTLSEISTAVLEFLRGRVDTFSNEPTTETKKSSSGFIMYL